MRILITGCAGFIGSNLTNFLLEKSHNILGIDSFSNYYSRAIKESRISSLSKHRKFDFIKLDLASHGTKSVFSKYKPEVVIHLAAQPGVRLNLDQYSQYVNDNLLAFSNVVLALPTSNTKAFLYASSSSVYGNQKVQKLSEIDTLPRPNSFYGATKLANEFLINSMAKNIGIRARGMRFFTVYGPLGRPDMAYSRIAGSAIFGNHFHLAGDGTVERDFTYIDDVVQVIEKLMINLKTVEKGQSDVVNIGGGQPVSINSLIAIVTDIVGMKPKVIHSEKNLNDVPRTCADFNYLASIIGDFKFHDIKQGMKKVVDWATTLTASQYDAFLSATGEEIM